MRKFNYIFFLLIAVLSFSGSVQAQIVTNKVYVYLKLTPRPSEKSVRDREVFFDQLGVLRIATKSAENPVTNATIQCAFLYDDVKTTGIVKRKVFIDLVPCNLDKNSESNFDSKEMRFTGKITRDGRLIGLKFLASAARVYEDGKLVYEVINPTGFEKDFAALVPPLPQLSMSTTVEPPKVQPITAVTPSKVKPVDEIENPLSEKVTGVTIDLYGYKFSPEESAKVIKSINEFSEDALVAQIGLSKQSAHNLVLKRPFKNLDELPKVSYVKKKAIELLKLYALKK